MRLWGIRHLRYAWYLLAWTRHVDRGMPVVSADIRFLESVRTGSA